MSDALVEEFLKALNPNTRRLYSRGLILFQEFYAEQGTIADFLSRVQADMNKSGLEKGRIARNTLNNYIGWLSRKYECKKTIRTYVMAVQSLAKYYEVPISLRYVNVPPPVTANRKHAWTIEEIGKFIPLLGAPIYRSIAASIVQSGLSLSDLLALTYGDISEEFEEGITPLCLDLYRRKTSVPFITFMGKWSVSLLKEHLADKQLRDNTPLYNVTERAVDAHFRRTAKKFAEKIGGRNPYSPHSLRAAFRTILSDHRVDPTYIEFWMGHHVPEQRRVYVSKSREGWREAYRTLAEPWLTMP